MPYLVLGAPLSTELKPYQAAEDTLSQALNGVLAVCAVVVTMILVRREFVAPTAPAAAPVVVRDWEKYALAGQSYGDDDAGITIVEFGDYQCPACRVFHQHFETLRESGVSLRLVFRHFPLPTHPFATSAAEASFCAAAQGRFKEMHDALYSNADSIGAVEWWWFGRAAGVVDSTAFERCLGSTAAKSALARDVSAGSELGVSGTPTLLIGHLRVNGVPPIETLRALVERVRGDRIP